MQFLWFTKRKPVRRLRRRTSSSTAHYEEHKEKARELVHARLAYWNQFYGYTYKRVAIRNQRSRWGSCSSKQNLNFNYKLIFLPLELVDYVIVHELCHLKHFNHSAVFWLAIGETVSDYEIRKEELRKISLTMNQRVQEGIHASVQNIMCATELKTAV